ncbi:MAG: crossover junction endodeoxyribonuclease RuvC [Labilithrix sp.]|nr:crossover junction endodeoxyribonuclease RuvC [Labilithrix sp.]
MTVVLGLDPGTRHFGWGVVRRVGTRLSHVAHGVLDVERRGDLGERLVAIEAGLAEVVREHAPTEASIESLFFAKDAQAAAKLGHARGVALLVCARAGLASFEYAPARVKRTIAGAGRADKAQVAQMIRVVLGLGAIPRSDAADALAIAVTHLQGSRLAAAALKRPAAAR